MSLLSFEVLIPCYNEAKNLHRVLPQIEDFFATHYPHRTITFVNDGSKDDTLSILTMYKKISKLGITIISYDSNHGKGYAVKKGIRQSKADYTLMMDADLATDLSMIHNIVHMAEENQASIIIGDRTTGISKRSRLRKFLGKGAQRCTKMILGLGFSDTQAGFKLFHKSNYHLRNQVHIDKWGFDFELLYLAQKEGIIIKTMPIARREQRHSKVTLQSYIDTFDELIKVRYIHSVWYDMQVRLSHTIGSLWGYLRQHTLAKINTPASWAMIALSGLLLTTNSFMSAQFSQTPYNTGQSYGGGTTSTGTRTGGGYIYGSHYSWGSSYGNTTSYQPYATGYYASGSWYNTNSGAYLYSGNSTSGTTYHYHSDYTYNYGGSGTSYSQYVTGNGTSQYTGYSDGSNSGNSISDYGYYSDSGSGTAYSYGSIYANSSSYSYGSTSQSKSDCSGICSKGSSRYSGKSYTSGTYYNRRIQNYGSGDYTTIGTSAMSTGTSYGSTQGTSYQGTGSSYAYNYSYGTTYSYSTTYGSGVDGSGSLYQWGTYISRNISTGSNTRSGTYDYSQGTSGSGSCVYHYEGTSRWKYIVTYITNWFSSPTRNSNNSSWEYDYEYGNTSSYEMKCDGGLCGGGCRECSLYSSSASKCVFKQPGKAVEYPTFVNPIYPYGVPVPGVDYFGTGLTYGTVCGTPPTCPCGGTYPSCNTCGGGYSNDRCGDGITQSSRGEQCDDGNTINTDSCSNQCMIQTGDWLDLTLHDPISCGNPFVGTINTNAPINLVSVTLYLSQQGSLKKTISLVPGSTSYSIRVNQGMNYIEPGVYDVELVGTVGSITKTLTLNGVSIQHTCPQDPPYHDEPIHSGAIVEPTTEPSRYNQIIETIFPKHILPKTGAY